MRRIRYQVAASLDGYIAGPNGEYDWIVQDPEVDFKALFAQFDTALIGRRTFELMVAASKKNADGLPGMRTIVFSRTLRQADYPHVTIVADHWDKILVDLRKQPGKDIWLFGGGQLFAGLLDVGLVDTVEVAVIPVLLGQGIPLLAPPARQKALKLMDHKTYPTGIVSLEYTVKPGRRRQQQRA